MRRHIARSVCKSGAVIQIAARVGSPRQVEVESGVKCVPLIVVQQKVAPVRRGEIRQTAVDIAESKGQLIGVGQIKLGPIANAGRTQRELPPVDAGALNRDRKENVGIVQIIVIEEVIRSSQKIVGVDSPASKRNGDAKLVFFVSLAMERDESQVLVGNELQKRSGYGEKRRRLIEVAVEAAKDPIQFRDSHRSTNARAGRVLGHTSGKMCLAKPGIQGEPGCRF